MHGNFVNNGRYNVLCIMIDMMQRTLEKLDVFHKLPFNAGALIAFDIKLQTLVYLIPFQIKLLTKFA